MHLNQLMELQMFPDWIRAAFIHGSRFSLFEEKIWLKSANYDLGDYTWRQLQLMEMHGKVGSLKVFQVVRVNINSGKFVPVSLDGAMFTVNCSRNEPKAIVPSSGPFTRPHPAVWRMVFGECSPTDSFESLTLTPLHYVFFLIAFSSLSLPRTQCHVLPIPRLSHFSQLGPSKDSDVLVGPKFALRYKRSWCDGENGSLFVPLCFLVKVVFAVIRSTSTSSGICRKLHRDNMGADLEPLWHLCLRPLWRLGHEGSAHS